jgi:hypothetical protein
VMASPSLCVLVGVRYCSIAMRISSDRLTPIDEARPSILVRTSPPRKV